jgi:large subunit ribosomal protein L4
MQATTYNREGKEIGKVTLPESVFDQAWNADLVHEVVLAMQSNARAGTAHTKVRGEVRGGGKKPWRQKGTGRARAGSRRSPIWRGGGVTFGPRNEKDYSKKINHNVRTKALVVVLSQKLRDNEIIFLDRLIFAAPKTKEAKVIIMNLAGITGKETLATKRKNAALVVLPGRDVSTEKSFRNFGSMLVTQAKDLNPVDLLSYKYIIVSDAEAVVELLAARVTRKGDKRTKGHTQKEAPIRPIKAAAKRSTKKATKKAPTKRPAVKTAKKVTKATT